MLLVHTAASSGTALSVHFCMGDYSGVSFAREKQSRCSNCGMVDKEGCCHDETQVIKLDAPAAKSSLVGPDFLKLFPSATFSLVPLRPIVFRNSNFHFIQHRQIDSGPPIHLLNCHFRI